MALTSASATATATASAAPAAAYELFIMEFTLYLDSGVYCAFVRGAALASCEFKCKMPMVEEASITDHREINVGINTIIRKSDSD